MGSMHLTFHILDLHYLLRNHRLNDRAPCFSRTFRNVITFHMKQNTCHRIFIAMFLFFSKLLPSTKVQLVWSNCICDQISGLWHHMLYDNFSFTKCLLSPLWISRSNSATPCICMGTDIFIRGKIFNKLIGLIIFFRFYLEYIILLFRGDKNIGTRFF